MIIADFTYPQVVRLHNELNWTYLLHGDYQKLSQESKIGYNGLDWCVYGFFNSYLNIIRSKMFQKYGYDTDLKILFSEFDTDENLRDAYDTMVALAELSGHEFIKGM